MKNQLYFTKVSFISAIALIVFSVLSPNLFSQPNKDEIFVMVEEMPRFPGCEDEATRDKKAECANQKLMEYIYANLKYPEKALKKGIEGRVTVRFVVTEEGKIDHIEILRDIGGGCGQAAVKVLESMNNMPDKWISGKQKGIKVKVYFTLPITFKLNDDPKSSNGQIINNQVSDNANSSSPCEQSPIFPLCTNLPTRAEMAECTTIKMFEFIYSNLKYPSLAKSHGIEGKVVLNFIVNKEGKIDNIKIVKDIGGGCGEEAKRVLLMSNKLSDNWLPELKDGKPIDSIMTVPVIFKLNG